MAPEDGQTDNIGTTVTEVSERVTTLVREEIELAKAEMREKAMSIARGAAAVGAGAVFGVFAVMFGLAALAWGINDLVVTGAGNLWIGFVAVFGVLSLFAALAFTFARRLLGVGAPTPTMAIDEAKKIRETVTRGPDGTELVPGQTEAGSTVATRTEGGGVATRREGQG